jgi:renalase
MSTGLLNVGVIGAGATGALTASLIAKRFPHAKVRLWDKARGSGGRMTTHRSPVNPADHVDMGAQYITRFPHEKYSRSENVKDEIFQNLIDDGVLIPFQGEIEGEPPQLTGTHYVSPKGLSSIPHHILSKSAVTVQYNKQIKAINMDNSAISLTTNDNVIDEKVDLLIITIPIPQLLLMEGNWLQYASHDKLTKLNEISYSSRYALGLFFSDPTPITSWTAKYFQHNVIRYACWDTLKYSTDKSHPPAVSALLVHSSVPFGLDHLEDDKEVVRDLLLPTVNQLIPGLPSPSHTYLIRWRYSQVFKGCPGAPGHMILSQSPLVILTGDSFTHSNFEGCIEAADSTLQQVISIIH